MRKIQILGILSGIVLLIGCGKPKVEVLSGREGTNFILSADPKDAKISFFKKDLKKEAGKQLEEVDFVLQGKSIEMNLLSNPLYMKLELGMDYLYRIEKDGFVTEEGDVNLKLGENLDKAIILYTEDELKSKKEENWSEYLGYLKWDDAKKKCEEVPGRRLPSLRELKLAYDAGITKTWQKDGNLYWSSTPYDAESYYLFGVGNGDTDNYYRILNRDVRCRR